MVVTVPSFRHFLRTLGRRVSLFSSLSLGKQTLIGLHFPHFTLLNWKRPILIIERHISYFFSLGEGSNSFYRANIIWGIKEDLCLSGIQKEPGNLSLLCCQLVEPQLGGSGWMKEGNRASSRTTGLPSKQSLEDFQI